MTRRYREGKLTRSEPDHPQLKNETDEDYAKRVGLDSVDVAALGTIADVRDFLDKVKRLQRETVAPSGSLRAATISQIEHCARQVERFLDGLQDVERQKAEHALVHMLHAAANYMHLLAELAHDEAIGGRRGQYLQARAATARRKKLATLAGFNSVQAMMKFEDAQALPRPRRAPRKSRSKSP